MVIAKKAGSVKKPRFGVIAKKNNTSNNNLIAISLILVLYLFLFIFLRNKILFTPDFGESDAYHLNLSLKYDLFRTLKRNTLPFWTNALEGGYPLFSEAQIGALFLPNIFFLKLFNFADAYNLLFISSLFFLTLGFYVLLKELEVNVILSLFFSLIFTFNGAISLRWVHLNLLQSFSLVPLLLYIAIRINKTSSFTYNLYFILILSQIIFAGHMQAVFIGIIGLLVWSSGYIYIATKKNIERVKYVVKLIALMICGFIVSLPQILPNYLLSQHSNRSVTLDYTNATSFPFNWSNLISFIRSYIFGNPRLGTYLPFSSNWGIFWENTPYLGLLFFIVLFVLILLNRKSLLKQALFTLLLSVCFILLALGKNSPFYFIFNFPPFDFFRTPSKYLLMTNFFIVLGTALLADAWYKKTRYLFARTVIVFALAYIVFDLFVFTFNYHLFVSAQTVLQPVESLKYINPSTRYVSLGQGQKWNEIFLKTGWNSQNDVHSYLFMKNFLYPNSNLLFDRQIYDLNTGTFHMRRPEYVKSLIKGNFDTSEINLMQILGIGNVISTEPIDNENMNLSKKLSKGNINIYIYKIPKVKNEYFYVPHIVKRIEYLDEFENNLNNDLLSVENSVTENADFSTMQNTGTYTLMPIKLSDYYSIFRGNFSDKTFIAFRQNIYPEWSVTIDGKKTNMYPVNLVHLGIIIPKGRHEIVLKYNNTYFKVGLTMTIIFLSGFLFLGIYRSKRT